MTLENWQYRDPMKVLEEKQEREARQRKCCNCANRVTLVTIGGEWPACMLGRVYGRACDKFKQKST